MCCEADRESERTDEDGRTASGTGLEMESEAEMIDEILDTA